MGEKRPTNSELRLNRLEEEDSHREHEPGILEIFDDQKPELDEDAPLRRDEDALLSFDEEASLRFDEDASPRRDPPE
jgi:hypothetical protein